MITETIIAEACNLDTWRICTCEDSAHKDGAKTQDHKPRSARVPNHHYGAEIPVRAAMFVSVASVSNWELIQAQNWDETLCAACVRAGHVKVT